MLSIEPCPKIDEGPGHVVTATMHGRRSQVHRLDLGTETIGTTPGHPFWSVNRAAWVEAGRLRAGERLQALDGEILVVRGFELGSVETVFNLEVNGAHHFAVGGAGVLAHNHCKTYETYTKTNPETGEVYTGRTSGTGTPEQNVANRDRGHHKNDDGFGPAVLDKSSSDADAIRGREQQLIDANGGAQSMGGTSGNAINGVSPGNPNAGRYSSAAGSAFGSAPR